MKKIIIVSIILFNFFACVSDNQIADTEFSPLINDLLEFKTTDINARIQIFLPGMDMGLGTAMKSNTLPAVEIKSIDNSRFTLIKFDSMTYNEAIDSKGKILTYLGTHYSIKEGMISSYNNKIKNGILNFNEFIDSVNENDLNTDQIGTLSPPDPNKFKTLRNVISYNFIFIDTEGIRIPIQIYIEIFTEASEL